MLHALEVATKELGYKELRQNQVAAIRNFLGGRDVFVSLPTGAGKGGHKIHFGNSSPYHTTTSILLDLAS